MQASCPQCGIAVDLFPSWVVARNAYPQRKPGIQIVCPKCGFIFPGVRGHDNVACRRCQHVFDVKSGPACGARATCVSCGAVFLILEALRKRKTRPDYRLYGKLILTRDGNKEYLPATDADQEAYDLCSRCLHEEIEAATITLPDLILDHGHNTRQAMNYGFSNWRDFFNDRHLWRSPGCTAIFARFPTRLPAARFLRCFPVSWNSTISLLPTRGKARERCATCFRTTS